MLLASPIFLLALLPWGALVLWLLLGKRRRVNVPFLELWKGPVTGPTARRRIGMPPIALAAALAALLLMILAAARPGVYRAATHSDIPIVIIVDRGITMSMGKPPRFASRAEELKPIIRDQFAARRVRIVLVPGGDVIEQTAEQWLNSVKSASPTAIDPGGIIDAVVQHQLDANPSSPLIVLTDHILRLSDQRLVCIGPDPRVNNIAIARVSARIVPLGQVMIRLRNSSNGGKAAVLVFSDDRQSAAQQVEMPLELNDYFFPIDPSAKVIRVEIASDDAFAGDNVAFLVRRGSWPTIEVRTPLFAELQRFIGNYSRLRPSSDQSNRVAIVSAQEAGAGPLIIMGAPSAPASGELTISDHPISKAIEKIDWKKLAADGLAEPAGDGWKPIVQIGGKVGIAVRDTPVRQVWVGLPTQAIANSPEFVMLWSNIFDWAGEGGEEFVDQVTGDLDSAWKPTRDLPAGLKPGWWPGIYRRADGALLAVNAPDVVPSTLAADDWQAKIAELAKAHRQTHGAVHLTTPFILAAIFLMLLAALTWRGGLRKMRPQQSPLANERVTV